MKVDKCLMGYTSILIVVIICSIHYTAINCNKLILISRARKIVTKFHNYSYEIVMSPVIVNSYKNGHNSYQIVK